MRKIVSKVLSVMAAMVLLMAMLPMAAAAFTYDAADLKLDVGATTGEFDVYPVSGDGELGEKIKSVNFASEGLTLTYTEPGIYKYKLVTSDATASNYFITAQVDSNASNKLELTNLVIQREGSDKKSSKLTQFHILLRKVSSANQETVLKGAKFEVYLPKDLDEKGELRKEPVPTPLISVETDEKGMADLGFLEPGYYYLKETKAPDGFSLNGKLKKLEINEWLSTDPEGKNVIFLDDTRVKLNEDGESATLVLPNTPIPPALPQTGQLWWPIAPLAIAGVLFIALALVLKRRSMRAEN